MKLDGLIFLNFKNVNEGQSPEIKRSYWYLAQQKLSLKVCGNEGEQFQITASASVSLPLQMS